MMDYYVETCIEAFYFIQIPITTSKLYKSNKAGMDSLILKAEIWG